MDEQVTTALSDLERRLSAVETRLAEDRPAKQADKNAQSMISGFVTVPIAVAVFAWLSGNSFAWIATGMIGLASIIAAVMVINRPS